MKIFWFVTTLLSIIIAGCTTPTQTSEATIESASSRKSKPTSSPKTTTTSVATTPVESSPNSTPALDLSGHWKNPGAGYILFRQEGNRVSCQGFKLSQYQIAEAQGTIVGEKVNLSYTATDSTTGEINLHVSSNGKILSGFWKNDIGDSGSVFLSR
ncbi:MAG: hypothetical protein F6K47_01025 [Symploca sp. SIO2E6]|nr:hypothetical protein [Symploca sp. SIO2E6]